MEKAKRSYFTALSNVMSIDVEEHGNIDIMMPPPRMENDDAAPASPRAELRAIFNDISKEDESQEQPVNVDNNIVEVLDESQEQPVNADNDTVDVLDKSQEDLVEQ